jgi:hypothetical protein
VKKFTEWRKYVPIIYVIKAQYSEYLKNSRKSTTKKKKHNKRIKYLDSYFPKEDIKIANNHI